MMVVTKKKLSCLANDKTYDRNYTVMLIITNNAKNYPVLRRRPTNDKTYTLPAQ